MDPKHRSRGITDGRDRAPARAMFKAIGFSDDDLRKPIIGVANTWIETMPCNFHLRRLSAKVKEGIRAAGGTPMEFNTIAISDGETMGTEGMKASLVSREVIADSIELVCRGQLFDAVVCVVGCDKTIPAAAMALARLNLPGLVLYGGTIAPGVYRGKDVTIQDVFEAVGANAAGKMTDAELLELENVACPNAGACGGQYTANTMSTVMELIGLSPMGFNGIPAMDPRKDEVAFRCGEIVMNLLAKTILPKDVLTHSAFENAIAGVACTGGSTNAVLHLLAIAREMGVSLVIEDFQKISERTPLLANLKPAGKYVAADVDKAGGIPVIAKRLLDAKLAHGAALTVTGRSFAEEAGAAVETPGQPVIAPLDQPLLAFGDDCGGVNFHGQTRLREPRGVVELEHAVGPDKDVPDRLLRLALQGLRDVVLGHLPDHRQDLSEQDLGLDLGLVGLHEVPLGDEALRDQVPAVDQHEEQQLERHRDGGR